MPGKGGVRLPSEKPWNPGKRIGDDIVEDACRPIRRHADPAIQRIKPSTRPIIHIILDKSAIMAAAGSTITGTGPQDIAGMQFNQRRGRIIGHKMPPAPIDWKAIRRKTQKDHAFGGRISNAKRPQQPGRRAVIMVDTIRMDMRVTVIKAKMRAGVR